MAFPVLDNVEPQDLLAIADAVAALPNGEEALRETSANAAKFTDAKLGYAHKVLAHLMLEGAIDILTTNWDNCIERGAGEERLPTITNEHDLASVTPPWVLKLHGCASRPASLLVTSAHIDQPPTWVQEQTHARLSSAVVIFIGIGDVAGYVERRIKETIHGVGSVENIRVVSPSIKAKWEDSQWKTVAPSLNDDHKIPETADLFMEQLAAAYIVARLDEHSGTLSSERVLADDLETAKTGLLASDSLAILQWARGVDIEPRVGQPVLKSTELGKALIALGRLGVKSARLTHNHIFETDDGPVEVLIATRTVPARRLVEASERRLEEHSNLGEPHPIFLVAGGVGPIPKPNSLPESIVNVADDLDIVGGPLAPVPDIQHADEVLAS